MLKNLQSLFVFKYVLFSSLSSLARSLPWYISCIHFLFIFYRVWDQNIVSFIFWFKTELPEQSKGKQLVLAHIIEYSNTYLDEHVMVSSPPVGG